MKTRLAEQRQAMVVSKAAVPKRIMIIGGATWKGTTSRVSALDLDMLRWKSLRNLPEQREQFGSAVLGGKVYVVGGRINDSDGQNTVFAYDIFLNRWIDVPSMTEKRESFGVAVLDKLLVAVGGCDSKKTVEAFDPRQGQWMQLREMANARCGHSVVGLSVFIYAIGGYNSDDGQLKTVDVYDIRAGRWFSGPPLLSKREDAAATAIGNHIVIAGGWDGQNYLQSAEVLSRNSWIYLPSMTTTRYEHGIAAIGSTVYVVGGLGSSDDTLRSLESLDITSTASGSNQLWKRLDVSIEPPRFWHGVSVIHSTL